MSGWSLHGELSPLDLQRESQRCGLMGLPPELLVMVLARVGLRDLANLRQVCRRLRDMVDGAVGGKLWATVSLQGLAVDSTHLLLIEKAAGFGNKEAIIKLAMAFLYNQGVPKGAGAGTLDSWNGIRAAHLLLKLDSSYPSSRPFSWFLIRPPWSSSVSNKVCAYHKMVERCLDRRTPGLEAEGERESKGDGEANSGLFYSLGQTVNFLEADGKDAETGQTAMDWFERGASHRCPFSALEVWRRSMKPQLAVKEVPAVRSLRKIIAMSNHTSTLEAKMELCMTYAGGYTGSVGREEAFAFIRDQMMASRPSLSQSMFRVQRDITNAMRFITVDWMIEIAELKSLSSRTLHQAVTLFDAYLLSRQVDRSALQLLGVTSILVASRWSGATMLTIRESSWLTDNTYSYDEVVKMMSELLGTFHGDIQRQTMSDYLEVLLALVQASPTVHSMATYLSEGVLLHPELSRFSSAHLAAACLLNAQIILRQDYPWPMYMEKATGFSLSSLSPCSLMIFKRCLTKEFSVADHRGVELCAIVSRY
ncbi:Cyclin-F, partial [Geodia barretti]